MLEECRYDPSRGIDYYSERLAALMKYVGNKRGATSTHVYTKEIRRALETLLFTVWDKADEYIPELARAYVPEELYGQARECYTLLLEGLLKRFKETTENLPMGAKIQLMNMLLSSIAEMARYNLPPGGKDLLSLIFSSAQTGT